MDSEDNITRRRALVAGGATVAFGGGVAYLATRSGSGGREYVPSSFATNDSTTGYGVELAGRPVAGDSDAQVDIYYWTDYLCPFCKRFETETLPKIGANYIDDGTVRLVSLLYPNIGEYSMPAAVWSRCVWRQVADDDPSVFWNWHGAAFEAQSESGDDWANEETFDRITRQTDGVSVDAVRDCRETRSDAMRETVSVDVDTARSSDIQGTPGFVLYNRKSDTAGKMVGAHPYETFSKAIDRVRDA
ncbi:DsbA family protein [Haloprofundus halophilus]|uniref:DsbA family protein n=1 Tax=Haloprofundus halophilus TaxID=2283527 RepID=UPI000E44A81A|nr:thioredoxin domain-containing protein [Haloprofundus halophilus]